jgi:hypothetical protein
VFVDKDRSPSDKDRALADYRDPAESDSLLG